MPPETRQKNKVFAFIKRFWRELFDLRRVGGLASLTVLLPAIGGFTLLGFLYQVSPWLRDSAAGLPAFVIGVIVLTGVALLPTNFIGVVGGWAFAFPVGLLATWAGVCGASVVMYFIARFISKNEIDRYLEGKPKIKMLRQALLNDGFGRALLVVTLLRLAPGVPFAATNLLLSTANVPLPTYLIGTAAGMLPRTAMVVSLGASLAELSFDRPADVWSIILSMTATVVIFLILGYLSKRALEHIARVNPEMRTEGV